MTRTVRSRVLAGIAVGALAATLGLPGVAAAATTHRTASVCALHPLPLPADMVGRAVEVDPTGRFVAGLGYRITGDVWQPLMLLWTVPPLHPRPGVWNEPRLTVVPTAVDHIPSSINRYGVVVGSASVDNVYRPWRYSNGHFEWLPAPTTVSGTWAVAINSRGDVVGYGAVEETETTIPLLWPADRPGTVEVIDSPPVTGAEEILDDGTIVGTAGGFGWVRHPDGNDRPAHRSGRPLVRGLGGSGNVGGGPHRHQRRPRGRHLGALGPADRRGERREPGGENAAGRQRPGRSAHWPNRRPRRPHRDPVRRCPRCPPRPRLVNRRQRPRRGLHERLSTAPSELDRLLRRPAPRVGRTPPPRLPVVTRRGATGENRYPVAGAHW